MDGSRVTRKRWRLERIMVVPAQWQGSVEHFYHFFLGYFMPLVLWQERTGTMAFTLRDCGPMNPWFSLLRPGTDIAYIQPGVMLQRVLTYRQERQILHGWDDPTRFHRDSMDHFVRTVLTRVEAAEPGPGSTKRITVLDRAPTPDFYLHVTSEVFSSGSAFRSLPNTQEISQALQAVGKVTLIDTASVSPEDQVRVLANTDLLVAQHGAGLANMVWMPPGSAVLEIKPPLVPTVNEIFANLAACRGLDHLAVDQVGEHTPIELDLVIAGSARLLSSPGDMVPPMPGRLPMRIVRQLPRRL
jgi:hypothetical protein